MRQFQISSGQFGIVDNYKFREYDRVEFNAATTSYEHMHSFTEIFLITSGKGIFCTKEQEIPLKKGTVLVNTPNVPHTEYAVGDAPFSYAVFSVENLTFTLPDAEKNKTFAFDVSAHFDHLYEMLAVIEREYMEKRPFWQHAISTEFNRFMLFLVRNTQLITVPFDSSAKPNLPSRIQEVLQSRYQENITLETLSEHFYLNKYYLSHAFKKKYGVTIMRYLNELRCLEAKKLLETTDLSITQIAICVGYNSSSHFSDSYKKIIGEAPAHTRKKLYEN